MHLALDHNRLLNSRMYSRFETWKKKCVGKKTKKGYKAYQGFRSGSEQQMIQNIFFKNTNFILFICSHFVHYT